MVDRFRWQTITVALLAVMVVAADPALACHDDHQVDPCEGASAASEYHDYDAATVTHRPGIDCGLSRRLASGDVDAQGRRVYRPRELVRRDQMASFLVNTLRSAGWGDKLAEAGADAFDDVAPANPHRDNINVLAHTGLVSGVGQGRYEPDGRVSREQMATFVVRAVQWAIGDYHPVNRDDADRFSDVAPDNVHKQAIEAGADSGLFAGTTARTFSPRNYVLREQMATFLARMLQATYQPQLLPPVFWIDQSVRAGEKVTGEISQTTVHAASATGCGGAWELSDEKPQDGWQFSFRIDAEQPPGECELVISSDITHGCRRWTRQLTRVLTVEP